MNWNIIRKTLRDRWKSTLVYAAALTAFVLMDTAVFPSFKRIAGVKQELLKNYPQALSRFFGIKSIDDLVKFNNFISAQLFNLMWVIIVGAFVIAFARQMVAGELHDGTLELLMAQPVERWTVLTSEGAVLLAGIVGLVLATVLGLVVFTAAFGISVTYPGLFAFILPGIALMVAIAGYSVLFSVALDDPRMAVAASAGLTLYFYLVHFAGLYSKVLMKVDWFGIFHYYNPQAVLESGHLPVRDVLVLLGFGAACFAASILLFRRRDIAP